MAMATRTCFVLATAALLAVALACGGGGGGTAACEGSDARQAGTTLEQYFQYVQELMPKNEPGSLTAQEYADVVAYLLRMNALPPGNDELSTDVTALKKIRIDKAK